MRKASPLKGMWQSRKCHNMNSEVKATDGGVYNDKAVKPIEGFTAKFIRTYFCIFWKASKRPPLKQSSKPPTAPTAACRIW